MRLFRTLFQLLGKQGPRTLAVFAGGDAVARRAIGHVRKAAPDLPIYLFTASEPSHETAALCEFVLVRRNPVALFLAAQRSLWPSRVALSAGAWTGSRGNWPAKLAPVVTPPFRAVLLNENGDFFPCTPGAISQHAAWRIRTFIARLYHRGLTSIARFYCCGLRAAGAVRDASRTGGSFAAANGLVALGALLRIAGYPHRRWFPKLHGTKALDITSVPRPEIASLSSLSPATHGTPARSSASRGPLARVGFIGIAVPFSPTPHRPLRRSSPAPAPLRGCSATPLCAAAWAPPRAAPPKRDSVGTPSPQKRWIVTVRSLTSPGMRHPKSRPPQASRYS